MSEQHTDTLEQLADQADALLDRGDLHGAHSILERICAADPGNADAWCMKGSVNGELGNVEAALRDINRAIEIDPSYAEAHYNIARIHYTHGNPDQAIMHLESAVSVDDGFFEAYLLLSAITGQTGQVEKCESFSRRAVALHPDSADANMNLANALRQSGNFLEAASYYQRAISTGNTPEIAHYLLAGACSAIGDKQQAEAGYKRFLELQPDRDDVWFELGLLYQESGRQHDAQSAFERAIRIRPDNIKPYGHLAYIYRSQDQFENAVACYKKALEFAPDSEDLLFNLGLTLRNRMEYSEAMEYFNRVLQINPNHAGTLLASGNILQIYGRYEQSIEHYRRCIKTGESNIKAHVNLAASLIALGRQDDAIEVCRDALEIDPDNADILLSSASALMTLGNEADALVNARKAVDIQPENIDAKALLSTILHHMGEGQQAYEVIRDFIDEDRITSVNLALAFSSISVAVGKQQQAVDVMEKLLLSDNTLPLKSRINLHFALGKQYDAMARYDSAIKHYNEGNRLKPVTFDRDNHLEGIRRHISFFNSDFMLRKPQSSRKSDKPVFIIGMPRSGTSLVEQILSSHPMVYGAGELPNLIKMSVAMQSLLKSDSEFPVCLNDITVEYLDALADNYLAHLNSLAPDASRVTDKMPGNFMNLGLIEMLFPNARIIHCKRNPLDTCLSIYFQDFDRSHPYSYDLENLAHYHNNYLEVMSHWRQVLTLPMYEIEYENLIGNPSETIMELIGFCGLEWDDRCLNFHKTKRSVSTASHEQVRQPIYNKSIQRWKHYENHIKPLIDALKPAMDKV